VRNRNTGLVSMDERSSSRSRWLRPSKVLFAVRLCALTVAMSAFATLGCGTAAATLDITAPATAISDSPFTVTVTVLISGKPDTVINSRIHFTSSDPSAVLPGDYYFVPADAGSHTWINGFVLMTPGSQTISADIVDATGINGKCVVTVSP
jgi:hypothetical protein